MRIRNKILLGCLCLTLVTAGLGIIAQSAQRQLGTMAVDLYDQAFMSMSYLRSAQNTLLTISRDVGSSNADKLTDRFDSVLSDLDVARERALSPDAREAARTLSERLAALRLRYAHDHTVPSVGELAQIEKRFDVAVEINAADGFRSRHATGDLIERNREQTWGAVAGSIAIGFIITLILSRSIVPAVRHAVGVATSIAAGRLDNHIPEGTGQSETSVLLRALATMQRSIAANMARINELMTLQASRHESEMARQHERFETALDNMIQGLCMLDDEGRVLVQNRRFVEMFAPAELGRAIEQIVPTAMLEGWETHQWLKQSRSFVRTLDDERTIAVLLKPMRAGGCVVTFEDVTERQQIEARIAHMARHDALTGLPNRVLFREHMQYAASHLRSGGSLAVLCLDLDGFKAINETLGHSVGDDLLYAVSQRLLRETRKSDVVVRLGGDEFAIIQTSVGQSGEAENLARRLLVALGGPFLLGEHEVTVSASIGIAIAAGGTSNGEVLLKQADLALYRAKAEGRGVFRRFEEEMDVALQHRRRLEIDLRRAIAERQFENFYQPLVDADSRDLIGFEALVRWRHPEAGYISPGEFIPASEEMGMIVQIGNLVLEQACIDAAQWPTNIKVAVNLSPMQFRNKDLVDDIASVLERSGLAPNRLELEITESLLLSDSETILTTLHRIRDLGIRISMDDFGTGYSSLSYLRRFPFDKIKIDQSFVRSLDERGDCIAIVRAVLGLGKSLGIRVLAEGVETEAQFSLLKREGCEQVQGYLFSEPRPLSSFQAVLDKTAAAPDPRSEQTRT